MKRDDFINKIKEMVPKDTEIWVQGFEQPSSCSWEAWTSDKILFEYDEDDKELTIRGDLHG